MFNGLINQKGFSIDRLATLCDVADKGNIKAATKNNATRQGQYSRQIMELEEFLGFELLDRTTRPSSITPEGKEISDLSRSFLSSIEAYLKEKRSEKSKIMFATGEGIIQWVMIPQVLPLLKKHLSDTNFIFKNRQSKEIIEGVRTGEFDFGIVRKSALKEIKSKLNMPAEFSSKKNLTYTYKLIVPIEMAKGMKNPVSMKKLSELPLTILEGPGELKEIINNLASKKKVTITPSLECSSSTQIWNLIQRKYACGFLPDFVINDQNSDRVKSFDVEGLRYQRELCVIWDKKKETMVNNIGNVLKLLKSAFK